MGQAHIRWQSQKAEQQVAPEIMELEQAEEQPKAQDQQLQQQWLHGASAHSVAEAEGRAAAGH